mgnify:CR=1 FL=1
MMRTTARMVYIVVLVAVLGYQVMPMPSLPQVLDEDRQWGRVMLTAVAVRELCVTIRALWLSGQRWYCLLYTSPSPRD